MSRGCCRGFVRHVLYGKKPWSDQIIPVTQLFPVLRLAARAVSLSSKTVVCPRIFSEANQQERDDVSQLDDAAHH